MRKVIFGLVVFATFLALLGGCGSNQMPIEKPKDFAFVLKYGIGAKNVLDTKDGTFTKDLIIAGAKNAPLKLSDEELTTIYNEMQKIKIMNYPEYFKPDRLPIQRWVTPHPTYELTIEYNGKEKRIFWDDESLSEESESNKLRNVINLVKTIIENKEEYKKFPEPQGGYM